MTRTNRKNKLNNLQQSLDEVILLEDEGHRVDRFSDVHWRIDDLVDVWPSTKKYMIRDGRWEVSFFETLSDIFNDPCYQRHI